MGKEEGRGERERETRAPENIDDFHPGGQRNPSSSAPDSSISCAAAFSKRCNYRVAISPPPQPLSRAGTLGFVSLDRSSRGKETRACTVDPNCARAAKCRRDNGTLPVFALSRFLAVRPRATRCETKESRRCRNFARRPRGNKPPRFVIHDAHRCASQVARTPICQILIYSADWIFSLALLGGSREILYATSRNKTGQHECVCIHVHVIARSNFAYESHAENQQKHRHKFHKWKTVQTDFVHSSDIYSHFPSVIFFKNKEARKSNDYDFKQCSAIVAHARFSVGKKVSRETRRKDCYRAATPDTQRHL